MISSAPESSVKDYVELMKPRVMLLVVFTSIAGIIIAPGEINPAIAIISILCITIGSGASGALNMWYDLDIDSIMQRTQKRPLVCGKIDPTEALSFGVIMSFFSVFVMSVCVNLISGIILLFTIAFYIGIYTMWLKRSTPQNIVIGGLAGALPPLIGWTSVTGTISIEPLILVLIIFMWTPAHFWALALYRSSDYKMAKVPMMPIIAGDYYTKIQILIYSVLTFGSSILPFIVGINGIMYLIVASILGLSLIYYSIKLLRERDNKSAPKMFLYSIFYLFCIFAVIILDHYIGKI
ncbi:MAG: hypothetical protein RLZZ59_653 [Pseudomonadota bacterium]